MMRFTTTSDDSALVQHTVHQRQLHPLSTAHKHAHTHTHTHTRTPWRALLCRLPHPRMRTRAKANITNRLCLSRPILPRQFPNTAVHYCVPLHYSTSSPYLLLLLLLLLRSFRSTPPRSTPLRTIPLSSSRPSLPSAPCWSTTSRKVRVCDRVSVCLSVHLPACACARQPDTFQFCAHCSCTRVLRSVCKIKLCVPHFPCPRSRSACQSGEQKVLAHFAKRHLKNEKRLFSITFTRGSPFFIHHVFSEDHVLFLRSLHIDVCESRSFCGHSSGAGAIEAITSSSIARCHNACHVGIASCSSRCTWGPERPHVVRA